MPDSKRSIPLRCTNPDCGAVLGAPARLAGRKVKCSICGTMLRVPGAAEPDAPDLAAASAASAQEAAEPRAPLRIGTWIEHITLGKRRARTAMRWALAASLALHLAITPLAPHSVQTMGVDAERYETEYQKKIMAAKNASVLARYQKDRITMPPPPPDPESVVSETLTESLTSDVEKVIGGLLDVSVVGEINRKVTASLKDEIRAASEDIAAGKLSKEEIEKLHREFQRKALVQTKAALHEHRVNTQEERAAMTTTEWYEGEVAKTLFRNLKYDMFDTPKNTPIKWNMVYGRAMSNGFRERDEALRGVTLPEGKTTRDLAALHQALRTEILCGAEGQKAYAFWVNEMVSGLEPMIRDMVKIQFELGLLVQKDGTAERIEDFPNQVVPLLRRDAERLIPQAIFARIIHMPYAYASDVTGERGPPDTKDLARERAVLAAWDDASFVEERREWMRNTFREALRSIKEKVLETVFSGGLAKRDMDAFVEGVDNADPVEEKLDARAAAMKGRGQDFARLRADGLPEGADALVALSEGAGRGFGASLQAVPAPMRPAYMPFGRPETALRETAPLLAKDPVWSSKHLPPQHEFAESPIRNSPRFEAIPFLSRFPDLDGDLRDWGEVRPLMLKAGKGGKPIPLYAAWNYQGFFFGYRVEQPQEDFYFCSNVSVFHNHTNGAVSTRRAEGVDWAFAGDSCRLFFDTLDARNTNRGEPHTQEFIILPQGTDNDASIPGLERLIASQRDAKRKEYRGVKDDAKVFPQQPSLEDGPDGTGPYRVTRPDASGYTTEVFVPRSLFKVPAFAPGWTIGFDCAIAMGPQKKGKFNGQTWATAWTEFDKPSGWGDLLLLGTDPRVLVLETGNGYPRAMGIVPGHSYLLTVVDPDRNFHASAKDLLMVSVEVHGGKNDVEIFVLEETKENSGVFRGFVDTQPGTGREVLGCVEVLPGYEVTFAYLDLANAQGERNVKTTVKLPVVLSVMRGRALTHAP